MYVFFNLSWKGSTDESYSTAALYRGNFCWSNFLLCFSDPKLEEISHKQQIHPTSSNYQGGQHEEERIYNDRTDYGMLVYLFCYALLCCVAFCCVVLCCFAFCFVVLCCVVLRCINDGLQILKSNFI